MIGVGRIGVMLGSKHLRFSPLALFAAGEKGVWLDPSDPATVWQDSARTVPGAVGSVVGCLDDKSGGGFHAKQAGADSLKPILREASGLRYLEFDGVDDFLVTPTINFTTTDKMSVFAGVRKLSDVAAGRVVELGNSPGGIAGSFSLQAPSNNGSSDYLWFSRGSAAGGNATATGFAAPATSVITCSSIIATDTSSIRVNGVSRASSAADQGTGNYANQPIYIGRRGGASLPFKGNIYGLIVRGAATSDPAPMEAWLNTKTGAY